jgi:hypothetical protein
LSNKIAAFAVGNANHRQGAWSLMAFVQYGHQTEAERAAEQHRRDIEQQLKELEQWAAVIVGNLRIMVRSGASKQNIRQLEDAQAEYGKCYSAIRDYASLHRLTGPNR